MRRRLLAKAGVVGAFLSMVFAFQVQAEDIPAPYQAILDEIREDFATGRSSDMFYYDSAEQMDTWYGNYNYMHNDLSGFGYRVMDFDGNGTPELLLGDLYGDYVTDMWTLKNGQAVKLLHGWDRSMYYFRDGDRPQLFNEWSGGADSYGADLYELQNGNLIKLEKHMLVSGTDVNFYKKYVGYTPFLDTDYVDYGTDYLRLTTEYERITAKGYETVSIDPDATYTETEHYYEIEGRVCYYVYPLRSPVDKDGYVGDGYVGEWKTVKVRFAKDANIEGEGNMKMKIGDYLKDPKTPYPGYGNCLIVHYWNWDHNGYITDATWIRAN